MNYDDFCGLNLGEYESLEMASRIAHGIAEHGEAFAKWVGYVGEQSEDLLTDERFQDHYLGHFDSTEVYAEYILEETGSYHYLDEIPENLRMYAKYDTEQMARDMEIELYIAEAEYGGVFVFDPRG
jgi:antirestriction protein